MHDLGSFQRLARLGADTLAIDASEENVKAAIMHASQDPLLSTKLDNGTLEYRASAVETLTNGYTTVSPDAQVNYSSDLKAEQEKEFFGSFDVVFAMEVVEHVADPKGFLRCLADLVKVCLDSKYISIARHRWLIALFQQPGGHIILSTISRTPLARLVAITLAESPLIRLAPAGSHTYSKFIRPEEIMTFFEDELNWPGPSSSSISASAAEVGNLGNHLGQEQKSLRYNMEVRGTTYLPWAGEWKLFPADDGKGVVQDLAKSCNYFFGARKPVLAGQ